LQQLYASDHKPINPEGITRRSMPPVVGGVIRQDLVRRKHSMVLFETAVAEIELQYKKLGHSLGWRFLCTSRSTLSTNLRIALLTANPGGDRITDHPSASCESGSAYVIEQWGTARRGEHKLQKQVQGLFSSLAERVRPVTTGNQLIEASLIGYFVPFRSPRWKDLHRPRESVEFARQLWSRIFQNVRPQLVITIDREAYATLGAIIAKATGARLIESVALPTGWGSYKADIDEYAGDDYHGVMLRLPHLSTFQLFTSCQCRKAVAAILDRACIYV
jgi:hypothetical protein